MNTNNTGTKTQKFTARGKTYTLLVKADATGKKLYSGNGNIFFENPATACVSAERAKLAEMKSKMSAAEMESAQEYLNNMVFLRQDEVFETAQSA